jgi:hypothetical protein
MDQGRQGRDQVDTAVVQDVRGQRRAAPASCARLQSWQLSPHACNTGVDQELVADELEGEVDQDRREGGEPRTLCRLPNRSVKAVKGKQVDRVGLRSLALEKSGNLFQMACPHMGGS